MVKARKNHNPTNSAQSDAADQPIKRMLSRKQGNGKMKHIIRKSSGGFLSSKPNEARHPHAVIKNEIAPPTESNA
jgi:hypothetical protein